MGRGKCVEGQRHPMETTSNPFSRAQERLPLVVTKSRPSSLRGTYDGRVCETTLLSAPEK